MKLTGKIPVPPLDEDRLTRIERRIVAGAGERLAERGPAPRRGLGLAAAIAFAAGAALAAWRLGTHAAASGSSPPVAQVLTVHGGALDLGDATISGDAAASYRVVRTGRDISVTLDRGALALAVEHHEGRRVVVHAGDTEVEDVGTKFTVAYDGARVDVRVTEGEVRVSRQQHAELVTAGHAWSTAPVVAMAEPYGPATATPAPAPATATATATAAATPAVPHAGRAPRLALHGRTAAVPHGPSTDELRRASSHAPAAHAADQGAAATAAANPYVDLVVAIRRQPIDFDPHMDGRNDAAAEIARLKQIAYSPRAVGAEASAAIYRIAVLLDQPLHQDAAALSTLDMYLRRFSGGAGLREYPAALWLRVRIACLHAFDDTCRQAAYSYQHEVPSGVRTDLAVRITNAP